MQLQLNAKNITRVPIKFDLDLTGQSLTFRLKQYIENLTPPLVEATATITAASATGSEGYIDVDLTTPETQDLAGQFYCEFEVSNGVSPPSFFDIIPAIVVVRLKNG